MAGRFIRDRKTVRDIKERIHYSNTVLNSFANTRNNHETATLMQIKNITPATKPKNVWGNRESGNILERVSNIRAKCLRKFKIHKPF